MKRSRVAEQYIYVFVVLKMNQGITQSLTYLSTNVIHTLIEGKCNEQSRKFMSNTRRSSVAVRRDEKRGKSCLV